MPNSKCFYHVQHTGKPWGDYGNTLIAGWALRQGVDSHSRLFDREAPLELERTGPFAPEITLTGMASIVVTDNCKLKMSGVSPSLEFRPVLKKLVVMSDWHNWDWNADKPQAYPDEGEPENYVMGQPHSEDAAAQMGPMWELCIDKGAWLDFDVQRTPWISAKRIHLDSWNGQDVFWAEKDDTSQGQWIIVTEAGKHFLQAYDKHEFLEFIPCLMK